jgi:hypothetical protein
VTQTVTEYGDPKGREFFRLRHYPVASVTTMRMRAGFNAAWETVAAGDYEADLETGTIYLKNLAFYCGPRTVEVVYTAGYDAQDGPALPADLVGAALEWVKFVFTRAENGFLNATSFSGGGHWVAPVAGLPKDLLDRVMAHRRVRL